MIWYAVIADASGTFRLLSLAFLVSFRFRLRLLILGAFATFPGFRFRVWYSFRAGNFTCRDFALALQLLALQPFGCFCERVSHRRYPFQSSPVPVFSLASALLRFRSCPSGQSSNCHYSTMWARSLLDAFLNKRLFEVFVKVRNEQNVKTGSRMHEMQKSIAKQPYYSRYRVRSFNFCVIPARRIVCYNRIIGRFLAEIRSNCQKRAEICPKIHR